MRLFILLLGTISAPSMWADSTLISNINGYTLDADRNLVRFSALQFSNDTIEAVFKTEDSLPENVDTIINGGGKTLLPGMIDTHGHILYYGLNLLQVDLRGSLSEQEAVQRVIDFRSKNHDQAWIQGFGWNQDAWDDKNYPSRQSLD